MDETRITEALEPVARPSIRFLKATKFYIILAFLQIFLYTNGERLFSINTEMTVAYIMLPWFIIGWALNMSLEDLNKIEPKKDPLLRYVKALKRTSIASQFIYFMIAFWASLSIFLVLVYWESIEVGQLMRNQAAGLVIANFLLVAPSETMVFHGALPWKLKKFFGNTKYSTAFRYVSTQLIFAAWHAGVYMNDLSALWFTFGMGLIFLFIAERYGMAATMGVHASWNLVIFGVLSGGMIG